MARATLLDGTELEQEPENDNQSTETEVAELPEQDTTSEMAQQEPDTTSEDEVPEKYRGKTVKELVEMHQNAEKALGRKGNENGELRQIVDQYILNQQAEKTQQTEKPEPEEDVDFFSDPEKYTAKAIENHPSVKEAKEATTQYKRQTALSQLQQRHPDMQEILSDNAFAEWVQGSKIRTQLFVQADQGFDHEAADELFSLWKDRQGHVKQAAEADKTARKQSMKAANTGNATASTERPRKVYRRSDIVNLMIKDPERYEQLEPEIRRAYQEGRVK